VRAGPLRRGVKMRTAILLLAFVAGARASDCQAAPGDPQKFAQAAQEAFERGDYAKAAASFHQALCMSPNNAALFHGLGLAEAAAGHFDGAAKALEQADRLSPHDFAILLARAQVEASAGHFEQAVRMLGEAEQLERAHSVQGRSAAAQLHEQLGGALLQQRKLDLALAQLLRARQAGLDNPSIRLMMATLENNFGAYSDAIRDASSLDDSAAATVQQRATAAAIAGLAYKNEKRIEEAIRLLWHSIELAPGETAYLALSDIYETRDQSGEAAKILEQALAAFPASQRIALGLGMNLVNAGENQRAVAFLSEMTQKAGVDPEAWRWLAQAQASLGEFQKATEALQQLARRKPDYPMIDVMVAQSLLKWETPDYEQALRVLDRAAQTAPADPDVYYMRGKVYFSLGRYAEAVQPLQRAIELGPTISLAYYQLGQVFQKLGREAEAKQQFDKVRFLKSAVE
jgi:tetratricopeptide (TPR) repeat protein